MLDKLEGLYYKSNGFMNHGEDHIMTKEYYVQKGGQMRPAGQLPGKASSDAAVGAAQTISNALRSGESAGPYRTKDQLVADAEKVNAARKK